MRDTIEDKVYERICKKFEEGIFTKGCDCSLQKYHFSGRTITSFPIRERTPEVCSSLMAYNDCRLSDVPEFSKTREFYISSFTDDDVYEYIKNNIKQFDRLFFRDLIESNEYATHFNKNCFAIMPLEYIDEEMCSLAIINSLNWSKDAWFYTVYERKPEALTEDIWKLGARLYSRAHGEENDFLNITPEKYKDFEYYKEMCSCNFNYGMELDTNKGKIMDLIPQEVITSDFLKTLLYENLNNAARFNEKAFETNLVYDSKDSVEIEKVWQFVLRMHGETIRYMELNDERCEYFMNMYDEYSFTYSLYFKDKYEKYKKQKVKKIV